MFTNSFYFINSLTSFNIFNLIVAIENHFLQLLILNIFYNFICIKIRWVFSSQKKIYIYILGGYLVFSYFNLFTNSFYFINSLTSFNIFNLIVAIENHFLQLLILIINYNCNAPNLYHFYFFPLLEFRYSKLSFSHIQIARGVRGKGFKLQD